MHLLRLSVRNTGGAKSSRREIDYSGSAFFEWGIPRVLRGALVEADSKHVFYESPGTAHEWQTWPS